MKALDKVRAAPRRAWEGTARTARWAGGGVARGPRRVASAIRDATVAARDSVRDGAEAALDRTGATRAVKKARTNPRVAIAWAVGGVLTLAWIGWAIYVFAEYGTAAGLGVLISWPAAIAALALVAAPFVGLYLLLQRLREPSLAGAAGLADATDSAERHEPGSDGGDDEDGRDDDDAPDDEQDALDDEEDAPDEGDEGDEPARA